MEKQLKVLFLLKRMDLNDGVSSHLETLADQLKVRGHRMTVISGPISGREQSQARSNRLTSLMDSMVATKRRSLTELFAAGIREVRTFRPDVIHAHGYSAALVGKILSILTFTPMVSTMHVLQDDRMGWKWSIKKIAVKLFSSNRFICISSDLRSFLKDECFISESKIDYIPNGINEQLYRLPSEQERLEARADFGILDDQLVCVLPGRLDWSKGHAIAVAAIRSLEQRLDVVCLFPGTGHNAAEIQDQTHISASDTSRFKFLGQLPNLRRIFHAADILVLPSNNEGFPLVVVEGMLSGCVPIRTPSAGAHDQIEDGVSGYIVPFSDPEMLAQRIEQLSDIRLRAEMAEKSHSKAVNSFTATKMTDQTLTTYSRAMTGH